MRLQDVILTVLAICKSCYSEKQNEIIVNLKRLFKNAEDEDLFR